MVKFSKSLQTQITVTFVFLILSVTLVTFFLTVSEGKKALKEQMREELVLLSDVMSRQIDGDLFININSKKDTGNKEFLQLYKKLNDLQGNNKNIKYIYTLKYIPTDKKVVYLVDGQYLNDNDKNIIDVYAYDDYKDAPVADIKKGLIKPYATKEFYSDEWGTFMGCYAPIKNSKGQVVAILAIDMDVKTVKDKQNFLSSLIYYVMGFAILLSALVIFYFSKTIITDLNKMTKVANKISQGELDVDLPEIKTKNELYEMNESLKSMFAAVEFLRDTVDELTAEENNKA